MDPTGRRALLLGYLAVHLLDLSQMTTRVHYGARHQLLGGPEVIADPPRSYGTGQQIEDPAHVAGLVAHNATAREHRGLDRLQRAAPTCRDFRVAATERGHNIGGMVNALNRLHERYGAAVVDAALREAPETKAPHPRAVPTLHGEMGLP